jgi:hypothetical protein
MKRKKLSLTKGKKGGLFKEKISLTIPVLKEKKDLKNILPVSVQSKNKK